MAKRLSGKRYAQALFELALEQNRITEWDTDLQSAASALEDPEFRLFLKHADVPREHKIRSVNQVLGEVDPMVRNLVALLVTRGAADRIPEVSEDYTHLLDAHLGRQRAEVVSAVPLDTNELKRIEKFVSELTETQVVLSPRVDESILGGVIIQVGDRLLDGSTRSMLEGMRKRIHSEGFDFQTSGDRDTSRSVADGG